MRYTRVTRRPTARELAAIEGELVEGEMIGRPGTFFVAFDDNVHAAPRWIEDGDNLNMPAEIHRCWNCGEPQDGRER